MRFGQTSLRWTGIPLLSCTLVALFPGPAAAAPGPGDRPLPRAVSSPGPYDGPYDGPAESWGERFAGRLPEALADRRDHGDHRGGGPYATGLPLPPLFGHHDPRDHHDARGADHRSRVAHGDRESAERDGRATSDGPGRRPAAGTADGAAGRDRPDSRTAPRTDARDGTGGDSSPAPVTSPSPSASQPEPAPSPEPGQAQPWSPAPVAPQDAERTLAGGAEPDPQQDLPGTEPSVGAGRAAPAAAQAPAGPILPVLPLGAGLTSLGLGLAFLALRLRRG